MKVHSKETERERELYIYIYIKMVELVKIHRVTSHCNSYKYNKMVTIVGRCLKKSRRFDFEPCAICD